MATAAPFLPLQIGQLVRRRTDPEDTPVVGVVGGLLFLDRDLVLVRWQGASSTFEPENTLVEVFRLRR
jgi:hypothetical protein